MQDETAGQGDEQAEQATESTEQRPESVANARIDVLQFPRARWSCPGCAAEQEAFVQGLIETLERGGEVRAKCACGAEYRLRRQQRSNLVIANVLPNRHERRAREAVKR